MSSKKFVVSLVCVLFVLMAAGTVLSDDKTKQEHGGAMDAMMQGFMKNAAPGPFHAHLKPLVGSWKTTSKFWMAVGAEPSVSEGTAERKLILGGRYLQEHYNSTVMAMPFQGFGMVGYDNMKKQYVSIWMDTMSTTVMVDRGTCDPSGKVFTYHGEMDDPFTGIHKKYRTVLRVINNDKHMLEMFETAPGEKERQSMEIIYTRS